MIEKGNGPLLRVSVIPGGGWKHGSRQLDLSIPLHLRDKGLGFYLLAQYFDGYGEALLSYNVHTSQLRFGVEVVR